NIVAVVIFEHGPVSEPSRIGGIVVRAIVIDGPVHELKIAVGSVGVQIEKVRHAEFAETYFEAAFRQFAKQGKRVALRYNFFAAKGNDLVPHQAGNIGSFAE